MTVGEYPWNMCNHLPGIYCQYCNPAPWTYPPPKPYYPTPSTTTASTITVGPDPALARLRTRIAELERLLAEQTTAKNEAAAALREIMDCLDEAALFTKAARRMARKFFAKPPETAQ